MAIFRKKPVEVEAITFAELVQHGLNQDMVNIHDGMPWSFSYKGHAITHENDECYLINVAGGDISFGPNDMLISEIDGKIYTLEKFVFADKYRKHYS